MQAAIGVVGPFEDLEEEERNMARQEEKEEWEGATRRDGCLSPFLTARGAEVVEEE